MLGTLRYRDFRFVAAIAFLIAIVSSSYAHLPVHASGPPEIDLSAYMLPDGSLPTLCLTERGDGSSETVFNTCDACRLVSAPGLLAGPCEATGPSITTKPVRYVSAPARFHPATGPSRPSARAPPAHA